MPNSLKCRLKWLARKGLLSEKDLSEFIPTMMLLQNLKQ